MQGCEETDQVVDLGEFLERLLQVIDVMTDDDWQRLKEVMDEDDS